MKSDRDENSKGEKILMTRTGPNIEISCKGNSIFVWVLDSYGSYSKWHKYSYKFDYEKRKFARLKKRHITVEGWGNS